ncbi:MAG: hypothetical protein ACYDAY_11600 [Candidatus Dormibacteria bacterium]
MIGRYRDLPQCTCCNQYMESWTADQAECSECEKNCKVRGECLAEAEDAAVVDQGRCPACGHRGPVDSFDASLYEWPSTKPGDVVLGCGDDDPGEPNHPLLTDVFPPSGRGD